MGQPWWTNHPPSKKDHLPVLVAGWRWLKSVVRCVQWWLTIQFLERVEMGVCIYIYTYIYLYVCIVHNLHICVFVYDRCPMMSPMSSMILFWTAVVFSHQPEGFLWGPGIAGWSCSLVLLAIGTRNPWRMQRDNFRFFWKPGLLMMFFVDVLFVHVS